MNVQVNNLAKAQISKKFISDWMTNAFRLTKSKQLIKDLSVAFVSEQEIKAINKKYRNINNITDVLSFADPAEIIICWDKLKQQAKLKKCTQKQELRLLLVHGLLHILGYNHQNQKQTIEMGQITKNILAKLDNYEKKKNHHRN
ncbi:rRNA maturation RNase YbeY [Patescibacteria group bacterium]|nr:rRNA maturation RNase YbeY [Patescibacteria group bacterium]